MIFVFVWAYTTTFVPLIVLAKIPVMTIFGMALGPYEAYLKRKTLWQLQQMQHLIDQILDNLLLNLQ
jgi:hypothetical protein